MGALVDLSGSFATVGKQGEAGIQLAVDEINETGFLGQGKKIEVDIQDTGGDPARSIGVATRWVQQPDILGASCCIFSNSAVAVAPILPKAGMPMVLNGSISTALVKTENVYRGFPLVQAGDTEVTEAAIKAIAPKTADVVFAQDNEGMVDAKTNIVNVLNAGGVKTKVVGTMLADTSYSGPASQIANEKPDMVVVLVVGNANGQVVKELRDRGYQGTIIADTVASAKDVYKVGGKALDGSLMAVAFDVNGTDERTKNFVDRWRKKFPDREPDQVGAINYQSIWLLARAIKQGGGKADRAAVLQGMKALTEVPTPMGQLQYGGSQEPKKTDKFALVQWSGDNGGTVVAWDGTKAGMLRQPVVG
ncbi:ABC transporter substrate-binding protein [Dactylosporangium sp. CA-139066]|uniref:ABC transporter substrate-binding protein n=1 Tax=Dactylosporangium sp. CA-139066 TaxID=3239930 RepID=UPI003D9455CE